METVIKKSTGLDDLLHHYYPQRHDEPKPLETSYGESDSNPIFELYQQLTGTMPTTFLDTIAFLNNPEHLTRVKQKIAEIREVMPPERIDLMAELFSRLNDGDCLGGLFVSQLLQNSYNARYNDFTITSTNQSPLSMLAHGLRGRQDRFLKLNLVGPVGDHIGYSCRYVLFSIVTDPIPPLRFSFQGSKDCCMDFGGGMGEDDDQQPEGVPIPTKNTYIVHSLKEAQMINAAVAFQSNYYGPLGHSLVRDKLERDKIRIICQIPSQPERVWVI